MEVVLYISVLLKLANFKRKCHKVHVVRMLEAHPYTTVSDIPAHRRTEILRQLFLLKRGKFGAEP